MRTWIVVVLAVAGAGCRKEEPARGRAAAPGDLAAPSVALPPADATAAPGVDAAADAGAADAGVGDAGVAEAPWPTAVEVAMITTEKPLSRTYSVDTAVPRFRTRPGALAAELNARFARFAKRRASDVKGYQGSYHAHCQLHLVSRFAVIVECGEMNDIRTIAEARAGTGGAPAGPTPTLVAVWLQPGLPAIELAQLAPGIDAAQVIARAIKGSPANCEPTWCEHEPDTFSLDVAGVVFRPSTYCSLGCAEEHWPRIPIDQLKPVHPWAVQLVGWIRERADAGEGLVEGQAEH